MKPGRSVIGVFVLLVLCGLSYANPPDQPYMQAARTDLQQARASLQRAEHNKGGHRVNAIAYINSAITEVNRGIDFDRTHGRRRNHAEIALTTILSSPALTGDQPNMRSALDHLKDAKRNLESATADKGGHRVKAIDYVNRAIDEVNEGIKAGS